MVTPSGFALLFILLVMGLFSHRYVRKSGRFEVRAVKLSLFRGLEHEEKGKSPPRASITTTTVSRTACKLSKPISQRGLSRVIESRGTKGNLHAVHTSFDDPLE